MNARLIRRILLALCGIAILWTSVSLVPQATHRYDDQLIARAQRDDFLRECVQAQIEPLKATVGSLLACSGPSVRLTKVEGSRLHFEYRYDATAPGVWYKCSTELTTNASGREWGYAYFGEDLKKQGKYRRYRVDRSLFILRSDESGISYLPGFRTRAHRRVPGLHY